MIGMKSPNVLLYFSLVFMRFYLGIDFGTSTCSAYGFIVDDSNKNSCFTISLSNGNSDTMPSVAAFWNGKWHVGYDALKAEIPRSCVIYSSKRLLGRRILCNSDYPELKYHMYNLSYAGNGYQYVVSKNGNENENEKMNVPVDIVAREILCVIREKAEKELKRQIEKYAKNMDVHEHISPRYDIVAISVPSMFHYQSCKFLREAAERAGFDRVQLVSEPVSAGFSYLFEKKMEGCYLVYDMGGGTFDTTLIRCEKGRFTTLGKSGAENCGGDNIDLLIYELVIDNREDLKHLRWDETNAYANMRLLLLDECRKAKESLKDNESLEVSLDRLGLPGNNTVSIGRKYFENKISNLISKTITVSKQLVAEVLKGKNLDGVILIGGSSNLHYVQEKVRGAFGNVHDYFKTDYVVSRGAALAAMMMKDDFSFENQAKDITDTVVNGSSNIVGDGLRPMTKELCDCTEAAIYIETNKDRKMILPAYTSYGEKRSGVTVEIERDNIQQDSSPFAVYREYGEKQWERIGSIPLNTGEWKEKDLVTFSAMMDSDRFLHVYMARIIHGHTDNNSEIETVIV